MGRVSTACRARSIALEIASYRRDYDLQRERIEKKLNLRWNQTAEAEDVDDWRCAVGRLASEVFDQSHAVIRHADRRVLSRGPAAVLTRRTLAMTAFAGTAFQPALDKVVDDCCLGTELKFVHGLEHHRLRKRCPPDHVAALILHDVLGEPFAYQKAVGHPHAYVWRNGVARTKAGLRQLHAGSIVTPLYCGDEGQLPPHEKYAGAGVVGITGCIAEDVEFKRFSVETLPQAIRIAGLLDASAPGAYEEYRCHTAEASAMNPAIFAGHMAELLKTTKNYAA